jgi:hypothetical protein
MSQVETDQYHPTLLVALHARTYREAIERLARYKKLCSAEEFRITQKGDEILVEVSWPFAGEEPALALLIDAVFRTRDGTYPGWSEGKLNLAFMDLAKR